MADAGLTVYNDSSTIQIDSTFMNYGLVSKGVLTFQIPDASVPSPTPPKITVTGRNPLIAYRSDITVSPVRSKSGNSFVFEFQVFSKSVQPQTKTIEYFIYDEPVGQGTYGLQVFDANGKLVFDSSRPYMKVLDVIDRTAAFPLSRWTETKYSYSNKKIAIVMSQLAIKVVDDVGTVQGNTLLGLVLPQVTGQSTFSIFDGGQWYEYGGRPSTQSTQSSSSMMVIDVTNT